MQALQPSARNTLSKKPDGAAASSGMTKKPGVRRVNSLEFEENVVPLLAGTRARPKSGSGASADPPASPPRAGPRASTLSAAAKDFELVSDDGQPSPQPPRRQLPPPKSKPPQRQHPATSPRSRGGSGAADRDEAAAASVRAAMVAAAARAAAEVDAAAHLHSAALLNHHVQHHRGGLHHGADPHAPPIARGRNASVGATPSSQHHFHPRGSGSNGGGGGAFRAHPRNHHHQQRQHMRPSGGAHGSHPHLQHLAQQHHAQAPHPPHGGHYGGGGGGSTMYSPHGSRHGGHDVHSTRSRGSSFNFDLPPARQSHAHTPREHHHHGRPLHSPRDLRDAPVIPMGGNGGGNGSGGGDIVPTLPPPRSHSPGVGDGPVERLGDELLVSLPGGAAAAAAVAAAAAKRSVFDDQIGKAFPAEQQFRDNYLSPKTSVYDEHPALREFAAHHLGGAQSQISSPRHARNPYVAAHHQQYSHQRSGSLPLPLPRGAAAMQSAPSTLSRAQLAQRAHDGAPPNSAQALQHAAQAAAAVRAMHGHQAAQQLQQRMQPLQPPDIQTAAALAQSPGVATAKSPSAAGETHLVQVRDPLSPIPVPSPATPMAAASAAASGGEAVAPAAAASAASAAAPTSPTSTDSGGEPVALDAERGGAGGKSGWTDSGRPPIGPGGLVTYKRRKRGRRPSAQAQREKRETKRSVYLSPLPPASTFETVSALLQPFGRLQTVEFIEDGKSCYARFDSYPQADRAVEAGAVGDGVIVLPKKVRVEEVKTLQESLAALDAEKRLLQERLGPLSGPSSASAAPNNNGSNSNNAGSNATDSSDRNSVPPAFSRTAALRGGRGHQRHASGPAGAGSRFGALRGVGSGGGGGGGNAAAANSRLGVGDSFRSRRKGSFQSHQTPGNPERSGASTLPRREERTTRGRRGSKERRPSSYGVGSGGGGMGRSGNRRLSVEQLESNWRGGSSHRRTLSDNSNAQQASAASSAAAASPPAAAAAAASAAPSQGAYQPPAQRQKEAAAAAAAAKQPQQAPKPAPTATTTHPVPQNTSSVQQNPIASATPPSKLSQQHAAPQNAAKPPQGQGPVYQRARQASTNIPVVASPPRGVPDNVRASGNSHSRTASAPGGAPPGLRLRSPPKQPQEQLQPQSKQPPQTPKQALSISVTSQLRPRAESASASSSPPKPGGHVILNGPASGMKAATGLAAVSVASKKKPGSRRSSMVSGTAASSSAASGHAVNIAKGPDGSKGFKWSHNTAFSKT